MYNYYDNWKDVILVCPVCGWKGKREDGVVEYFSDLFDISCPKCDKMLAVVSYPTIDETKEAASDGHEEALMNLPTALHVENRKSRFQNTKLESVAQLPEICGNDLEFIWDFARKNDEIYNIIKHNNVVLWEEIGFYESVWRFNEVKNILKKKYRERFKSLKPSEESEYYLYGDRLSSLNEIEFY